MNLMEAYRGSFFTVAVAEGADPEAVKGDLNTRMAKRGVGQVSEWHTVSAAELNEFAGQFGEYVPARKTLVYLVAPLTGLNSGRLVDFRWSHGGRWFDDVVNNMTHNFED